MYGVDLATEWRGRRWRRLLNLIEHLPRNTHYVDAIANDDEAARQALELGDDEAPYEERWSEWSPERSGLARIEDQLQILTRNVSALAGAKSGTFRPAQRPTSARERLKDQRRKDQHRTLVARVVARS